MADLDPIVEAVRRAKAAWSDERFPAPDGGNRSAHEVGTVKGDAHQGDKAMVPTVPTVPTSGEKGRVCATGGEASGAWEERAAILEYDGGFSRAEAERRALAELGER